MGDRSKRSNRSVRNNNIDSMEKRLQEINDLNSKKSIIPHPFKAKKLEKEANSLKQKIAEKKEEKTNLKKRIPIYILSGIIIIAFFAIMIHLENQNANNSSNQRTDDSQTNYVSTQQSPSSNDNYVNTSIPTESSPSTVSEIQYEAAYCKTVVTIRHKSYEYYLFDEDSKTVIRMYRTKNNDGIWYTDAFSYTYTGDLGGIITITINGKGVNYTTYGNMILENAKLEHDQYDPIYEKCDISDALEVLEEAELY